LRHLEFDAGHLSNIITDDFRSAAPPVQNWLMGPRVKLEGDAMEVWHLKGISKVEGQTKP